VAAVSTPSFLPSRVEKGHAQMAHGQPSEWVTGRSGCDNVSPPASLRRPRSECGIRYVVGRQPLAGWPDAIGDDDARVCSTKTGQGYYKRGPSARRSGVRAGLLAERHPDGPQQSSAAWTFCRATT